MGIEERIKQALADREANEKSQELLMKQKKQDMDAQRSEMMMQLISIKMTVEKSLREFCSSPEFSTLFSGQYRELGYLSDVSLEDSHNTFYNKMFLQDSQSFNLYNLICIGDDKPDDGRFGMNGCAVSFDVETKGELFGNSIICKLHTFTTLRAGILHFPFEWVFKNHETIEISDDVLNDGDLLSRFETTMVDIVCDNKSTIEMRVKLAHRIKELKEEKKEKDNPSWFMRILGG